MSIPITYFRSSSYSCHDQCPQKFFGEYILGWSGLSNKKADQGTIVHKVMEILAAAKLAKQQNKRIIHDEIAGRVTTNFNKLEIDPLTEQVYDYYAAAFDHHEWEDADLRRCKRLVHKALDFNNGAFDPRMRTIVDVEQQFDIEINEPWAAYDYNWHGEKLTGNLSIKGTVDLITEIDTGIYEIVDWKTGKAINWTTGEDITYESCRKNPQLRIYHFACCQLYPEAEHIILTVYYIDHNKPFTVQFGREDIPDTLEIIRTKFEDIKSTSQPKLNKSWKCNRLCSLGKTTFEDTHVLPILEKRRGQVTPCGEWMTKCEQIKYCLEHRTVEEVTENMSEQGYNPTKYKSPGSTE